VIKEGLQPYLKDNTTAWEMLPEGSYRLKGSRGSPFNAQHYLLGVYGQESAMSELPVNPE
jgi:polyphosphate kinase